MSTPTPTPTPTPNPNPNPSTMPPSAHPNLDESGTRPSTLLERLQCFGMALVLGGLSAAMIVWPNPAPAVDVVRNKTAFYLLVADWAWSMPVGILLAIPALFMLYAALRGRVSTGPDPFAPRSSPSA